MEASNAAPDHWHRPESACVRNPTSWLQARVWACTQAIYESVTPLALRTGPGGSVVYQCFPSPRPDLASSFCLSLHTGSTHHRLNSAARIFSNSF